MKKEKDYEQISMFDLFRQEEPNKITEVKKPNVEKIYGIRELESEMSQYIIERLCGFRRARIITELNNSNCDLTEENIFKAFKNACEEYKPSKKDPFGIHKSDGKDEILRIDTGYKCVADRIEGKKYIAEVIKDGNKYVLEYPQTCIADVVVGWYIEFEDMKKRLEEEENYDYEWDE